MSNSNNNTYAADHQAKVKFRSALILSLTGLGMTVYSLVMFLITNDIDFLVVFIIASSSAAFGILNLDK